MRRRRTKLLVVLCATALGGCATTTTQFGTVEPEVVKAEEARQRALALQTMEEQQLRLEATAWPILTAGTPFCEPSPRFGLRAGTVHSFDRTWAPAARQVLLLSDTLSVIGVIPGGPAEAAGLRAGDRILAVDEVTGFSDGKAAEKFGKHLASHSADGKNTVKLTIVRDGPPMTLDITAVEACPYGLQVIMDGSLNAFADGNNIYVTSAMMRFTRDHELAVIVGHEFAHNSHRHIDAMRKNMLFGALLGALGDVAMASQGIQTGGAYTNQFAQLGAMTNSQNFEREADYVGMYVMALAGLPLDDAPTFWRHMAIAHPGSIQLATSHPTTAERFVRLEQTIAEIREKQRLGLPLRPEMKKDQ